MNKTALIAIQEKLAKQVILPPVGAGYRPKKEDTVFGLDAHYVDNQAYVGLDAWKWNGSRVGTYVGVTKAYTPYMPHFFCFREGPPLLSMIMAVQNRLAIEPDLIIVDSARPPTKTSTASIMIDFPAPVSPVKVISPGLKDNSRWSMMAKFSIRNSTSINQTLKFESHSVDST